MFIRGACLGGLVLMLGVVLVTSCKTRQKVGGDDYLLREGWDSANSPLVFGDLKSLNYDLFSQSEFLQGTLDTKPWSDTYWPLAEAGLAYRWNTDTNQKRPTLDAKSPQYKDNVSKQIEKFLDDNQLLQKPDWIYMSPAEKYDSANVDTSRLYAGHVDNFEMTRKELTTYAENYKYYTDAKIPWTWMGHCHGWAIAALLVEPPKHAVRVVNHNNAEIIFTEGDIRGLISKAFADNATDKGQQFLGTRCNIQNKETTRDAQGRIVDGVLGKWDKANKVFNKGARNIKIEINNWRMQGLTEAGTRANIIVFREMGNQQLKWLLATRGADPSKGVYDVEIRDYDEAKANTASEFDQTLPAEKAQFQYLKACRDLNPGAFHIVLNRLLSDAARKIAGKSYGFVMDVTRADEVWNHPIYSYQSRVGALTPLADQATRDKDPFKEFRATGTEYLVHVITRVTYGVEHGPLVTFDADDDHLATKIYQYTLELDKDKNIIGGEWHAGIEGSGATLPEPQSGDKLFAMLSDKIAEQLKLNSNFETPDGPDFIWRFPEGTQVTGRCQEQPCMDPKLLYAIHACSLKTPTGERVVDEVKIPYVDCQDSLFNRPPKHMRKK